MLTLHGYWRSSAAYRIRIALNLKGLDYQQISHNLRAGEQRDPSYTTLAPHGLVPALEHSGGVIIESLAIMEWLEARFPSPSLIPTDPDEAAIVRGMAALIASDIHPVNNLRVLKKLKKDFGADQSQIDKWNVHWINEGFTALDKMIAEHGGLYAFGDNPTMADCFLVPQVYNAERFAVDLSPFPHLLAATTAARGLAPIAAAEPSIQPDADPKDVAASR